MINFKDFLEEKRGLWDNIHDKQKRIKNGSGEHMRKPGSKGAPTAADFKAANEEVVAEGSPFDTLNTQALAAKKEKQRQLDQAAEFIAAKKKQSSEPNFGTKLVKVDQRGHSIRTGSKGDKGVAEALTYPQKHSSWSVRSPKKVTSLLQVV